MKKKVDETIYNRFISEWEEYFNTLSLQQDQDVKGSHISKKTKKIFTSDQKKKLKKLKNVIKDKSSPEGDKLVNF